MPTPAPTWRSPTGQRPSRDIPKHSCSDGGVNGYRVHRLGDDGPRHGSQSAQGRPSRARVEPVSRTRALVGQGATACESPTEAFQAGVVISMLADDDAIREVLQEDVLARAPRSAIHVNMATISVALAKELTQVHVERGL